MHSGGVSVLQPGVLLANQSPNRRSHKKWSVAVKPSLEIHALQAGPAFGAISGRSSVRKSSLTDLQCRAQTTLGTVTLEMPVNCFGEIVDDAMVEQFGMAPTQENRARLAMRFINIDDKKGQASRFVSNLKEMYGNGSSTLCILYNASGDTIHYSANQDWYSGSLFRHGYPEQIGNGQWAAWLHVHKKGAATGTFGAVVYRGKSRQGRDRDFLVAWDTPWSLAYTNKAYCEIGTVNFYEGRWDEIYTAMENSDYTSTSTANGVQIQAETERGTSPTFTAVISEPS